MGWGSAGEIFEPVARQVVAEVEAKYLTPMGATRILTSLIQELQAGGWDTGGESLEVFAADGCVVHAFMNCDVFDEGC